jgi:hypothetical protein
LLIKKIECVGSLGCLGGENVDIERRKSIKLSHAIAEFVEA